MDQPGAGGRGGGVSVGGRGQRAEGQADASQWGWGGQEGESGDERGGLGTSKVDRKPAVPPPGPRIPSPVSRRLAEKRWGLGMGV